ncbi:biliverdin-producing heme oxygenase [Shinella curvata]|uniref:Biliverdin-producing heme oxygenase n=1 Tax=Shinella curvata TaxID=1817964 RepID=A0ABT8XLF5_9HYPH|nr:biliverdin-producing heme oxygenase [Shinella curvata]MCJ8056970.1 biliverdin-producing heme oxygenase [Shinella curvata]MDO6124574.1 biliverdin-producing heme oxygenase [Shinella curvata]
MAISERRFELRERTQAAHQRLDSIVGGFDTIDQYRRYLVGLTRFRAAMDEALRHVAWPVCWEWRPTAVSDVLERDNVDLGLSAIDIRNAHFGMRLANQSALLGALYVIEGSTLGARILQKRAAALGFDEFLGARHLAVMSKDIAHWQSFLLLLDEAQNFDVERAAASANAVFAFALQCFESEIVVAQ